VVIIKSIKFLSVVPLLGESCNKINNNVLIIVPNSRVLVLDAVVVKNANKTKKTTRTTVVIMSVIVCHVNLQTAEIVEHATTTTATTIIITTTAITTTTTTAITNNVMVVIVPNSRVIVQDAVVVKNAKKTKKTTTRTTVVIVNVIVCHVNLQDAVIVDHATTITMAITYVSYKHSQKLLYQETLLVRME